MCRQLVDFGFTKTELPVGSHVCQIYNDDAERNDSLLKFIASGLKNGECNACFTESVSRAEIESYLAEQGIDLSEAERKGAFSLAPTREVYFQGGEFIPERMLNLLKEFHARAQAEGYTAARVIGEMSEDIDKIPGGSRLLEYESKVSLLLKECPVTAVCQYDARKFDGATIMDVLKVHPMMVVRGQIVRNPFFIAPEEFLGLTGHSH